jgi:Family of unknown function (DUF6282)
LTAIDVNEVLLGAVDLHCHSGPSPMPRRVTHAEAAAQANDAGFRAIVVKCHYHDTVTDVLSMAPLLEGISTEVYGGIALNSVNGGLNPHAVDRSLKMGGKIVWFPTISARAHLSHAAEHEETQRHFQPLGMMQSAEVSVFDAEGRVRPEVHTIIELAKESDALVSTGHLDTESAMAVVDAAAEVGHQQVIVSHPNYVTEIDGQHVARMVEKGAFVEHEIAMYHNDKIFPLEVLLDWIERIGPEHTVLGSDLGQVGNPLPVEGYLGVVERLLDAGLPVRDIQLMIRDNPARLIGLDR